MNTFKNISLFVLSTFFSVALFAQDDTEAASHAVTTNFGDVTIIDLESTNPLDIELVADYGQLEAGEAIDEVSVASNNEIWLNWTAFAPDEKGASFDIVVKTDQNMNSGWGLDLSVNDFNKEVGGAKQTNQTLELSTTDQRIVRNIHSVAWSGSGVNKGANLKYDLVIRDADAMSSASGTINVTYTIVAR